MRQGLDQLVSMLDAIDGIDDLTLTTNGYLLADQADALRSAGLRRVTVSLDTLDPAIFGVMNGKGYNPDAVLDGIAGRRARWLRPHQDQRRRRARRERPHSAGHGAPLQGHRPHRALHRVHGRRHAQRLAARQGRAVGGTRRAGQRRLPHRAARPQLPRRGRRTLALPRRRRRARLHLVGHASRSAATATASASRRRARS